MSAQESRGLECSMVGAMGKAGERGRAQIAKDLTCGANELGLLSPMESYV